MPLPFTKQLSLANIMAHLEASEKRVRCLIEGEEVLNAGHRICCGVKACNIDAVAIQGLCLQTSHVREKPHELELVFDVNSRIKDHCSCKAGNAERCKHMIAMLLHVNRYLCCWFLRSTSMQRSAGHSPFCLILGQHLQYLDYHPHVCMGHHLSSEARVARATDGSARINQ
ncbi:uncharacterized protein LOC142776738 isoform X1 [Rhipicephalus microplus]|uniref:uncharacterized protein LOC142776738 isoform X1 n=1 Tax=Rhipicephalus microplus TaxID=6941 RepID=UPI003F6AB023